MKLHFLALLVFTATAFAQRQSIELSSGWQFAKTTGAWENVTVPHTWNAFDGQDGGKNYFRGACEYRRSLDIPASWKGKRIFLRFEAVSLVAKVFLNGQAIGEHRGAFTAFCFEATPFVKVGQPNELRVEVDNSKLTDVPPLSGDFNVCGGIYRPVWLIATDPVCITPLELGSPGVFITATNATVEIKSLISNGLETAARIRVDTTVGENRLATDLDIPAGKTGTVTQKITLPNPRLWRGLKDPYLYTATVRIRLGGRFADEVTQTFGIRTVAIKDKEGFLLNGEPYSIHGINRHQEKRDKGWALTAADDELDLQLIKDMGVSAIRLAHYPQSDRFHNRCDQIGILLWDEVPFVNDVPTSGTNIEQQLREMIAQRYNHPSIFCWGIFNEISRRQSEAAVPYVRALNDLAHELDHTRFTVAASHGTKFPSNFIVDRQCYNIYPGWYVPYSNGVARLVDERYAEQGDRRIGFSEYGAGANPKQHKEGEVPKSDPGGAWHPEEWQLIVHERDYAAMKDNPKVWGTFLWVMFDFAVDARNEGSQPGLNDKGMVTGDRRLKKDVYYFYQANWTIKPMVYIASRRMTPRKQATTEVKVYSNCPEVELKVNGKSLGKARPDKVCVFRWDNVQLQPGKNTVEAISRGVTDRCEWELQ